MVAKAVSSTSIQVRFQAYTGASSYKIYRATDAAFTTPVLIYSGAVGSVIDTGLSALTLYHYKMVAVIASVDTDITTFRANTI